jgi:aspartate carbamoyltransferase catalytic subunit
MEMSQLVSTAELSNEDLFEILNETRSFVSTLDAGEPAAQSLAHRHIVVAFFEPSTRTRLSFQLAAQRLGATTIVFQPEGSSLEKGESYENTLATLDAMRFDATVVRHSRDGAVAYAASLLHTPVINAGEGRTSHPTQGLLDASALLERFGSLRGIKICLVGDVEHSRVARSQVDVCARLGAEFGLCAPYHFFPNEANDIFATMQRFDSIDDAMEWADVMSMLRIQRERIAAEAFPNPLEYAKDYALNIDRLKRYPDLAVIHPGPVNIGTELDQAVVDSDNSLINRQVTHGVAVRMAVLQRVLGPMQ